MPKFEQNNARLTRSALEQELDCRVLFEYATATIRAVHDRYAILLDLLDIMPIKAFDGWSLEEDTNPAQVDFKTLNLWASHWAFPNGGISNNKTIMASRLSINALKFEFPRIDQEILAKNGLDAVPANATTLELIEHVNVRNDVIERFNPGAFPEETWLSTVFGD